MTNEQDKPSPRLFVGCFGFINQDTDEEGTFQIAVQAQDPTEATAKCRARLDAIADSSANLGPIDVYLNALVEFAPEGLAQGTLINLVRVDDNGTAFEAALPEQGLAGNQVHDLEDIPGASLPQIPDSKSAQPKDDTDGLPRFEMVSVFWSGVESFRSKWKLYWCETDDHDEDWFVVAHHEDEAREFHEQEEGYDEDEASAEFICVLPASEQGRYDSPWWPESETIIACGGEFLPLVNQDGADHIREMAGSGSRVVRIKGQVYGEGDIVGNTMRRLGMTVES